MDKLTFVSKAYTEQSGGGVMLDFLTLEDGTILCISEDMIGLYDSMESFENNDKPPKTILRYDEKPVKPNTKYLLFGKDVCNCLLTEGLDETMRLIEDGAEYLVIDATGTPVESILDHLSTYGEHSFITQKEFDAISIL